MENTAKLTKLSQTVAENAQREAREILEAANGRKRETLEREKERLSEEIAAFIREESARIRDEERNAAVMASLDYKKGLLAAREEYIEKIFGAALEKVRGFAGGQSYADWFEAQYKKLAGFTGVIKIREQDAPLLQKIAPGQSFEVSGEIKLGGFAAENSTRVLDLTLDTKYKNEMQKFVCVGAFIIDK